VAKRPRFAIWIDLPSRAFTQRLVFAGLLGLSAGLLVLGKAEVPLVERFRMRVVDAVLPILDALSRPAATVADLFDRLGELARLREENERLRIENDRLLQWQTAARALMAENESLRTVLKVQSEPGHGYISARVVADGSGSFARSVLVNAGNREGVAKGQAALTAEGLIGRVGETGERSARILLLTDLNSQIPVLLESSRERALLAGDNSGWPRLTFLTGNERPSVGDRVITSGHGGILPAGLPVGVVVAASDDGIRVQPHVNLARLDYVRLVDYGLDGALQVGAPPPTRRPGPRR